MRFLFVEPAGRGLGGAERSLAGLTRGLTDRGHDVCVLTQPGADAIEMFGDAGATIETAEEIRALSGGTRHGSALRFVTQGVAVVPTAIAAASVVSDIAKRFRADVVHSNGFRTHILAPLLRPKVHAVSWSLRDFAPHPVQRRLLRLCSRAAHIVLANSEFTAQQLPDGHRGVHIVGNPVTLQALPDRIATRAALNVAHNERVVAVIGHLHPSKGQHVAVAAAAMLRQDPRFADVRLLLAGEAAYGTESERYARDLLKDHSSGVALLGPVRDIERIYAAVDLVVQPSIHPEGFGRSVVEAQLAGVPVVATAIGGARELVTHGVSGILCRANDVTALRDAIALVLSDHSMARRLVAGGAETAQRFHPDMHIDAVERAFLKLEHR